MAFVSENTSKKKKELDAHEALKPGEYQGQHQSTINGLMDQIVNRKDFSYDFNADPLYQQYKDSYVQQGNQAMMNTMANAATLTGGFGNSYATAAGAQANQQYLQGLNDVIPELYQAAMDKYNMDTDNLVNQYGVVTDADDRAYGRYADALANWQNDRNYLYGLYQDAIAQDQYNEQFDYQKDRDTVADKQWQSQFDYTKDRDAVADKQYQEQFDYQKDRDSVADQQWQSQFDYQKERDNVSDKQWQTQWDYQVQQDALKLAGQQATQQAAYYGGGNNPVAPTANESVAKIALQKALKSGSGEVTAEYLASKVNDGTISQAQAEAIYVATQEQKRKNTTTSTRGGGANTISKMTR